tara:strand:+ start:315 stop:1157 length:843 start_codon:yes stop_codon:yes gene_type:complete
MNIKDTINFGAKILIESKIINPYLDTEVLLSKVIKKDKKYILLNLKEKLKKTDLDNFYNLIQRRSKREPVAYLLKKKEFWKYEFYVNNDVLIPRPETEIIIEEVLNLTREDSRLNILDIGVGSGCILLSILSDRKNFCGTGIDISKKSLKVSKINAKKLNLKNRVKFFNSDVDKFSIGKYDIIVSNPPYIENLNLKYLDKDVKNFEPNLALNGGLDGISKIRKVINRSSCLIKKNGKFVLEIGFTQKNKVIEMLKEKGFYINKVLKDYAKKDRCIVSTKI